MRSTASMLHTATAFLLAFAGTALGQDVGDGSREVARHGSWTVMVSGAGDQRSCFAVTQPKSSSSAPTGTKRDQAYVYISAWPKDGVRAEISVSSGFTYRRNSNVTLTVGITSFSLFTAKDRAYVADPTTELKLIDAMKKGTAMLVEGIDERGMRTTDMYTLGGLTQTLAAIRQNCG